MAELLDKIEDACVCTQSIKNVIKHFGPRLSEQTMNQILEDCKTRAARIDDAEDARLRKQVKELEAETHKRPDHQRVKHDH